MVGTDDGASDGWPDVLDRPLRSLVDAAEAAVPGGLEGGPGDIRPHDVFAILEKQAGRILTRDDKAWVKTRLDLLVMQLHPPSLVRPGLYLGTWYNACDLPQLRARGVTHVLNMCGEEHFAPPSTEYAAAGIRCHRCPVTDQPDADISPHLRESMHFLQGCDRASGPAARCLTRCVRSLSGASSSGAALIHCEYGVSRSGTMALAWLMHSEGLSLRDALLSTRAARPQVRPNPGFWRALVAYERELRPGLPPSLPSQGAVLEGWLLMSEPPMGGAGAPLWEPRWVEVCTICGAPRGAEARGVHGGLTGADPFVVYEESQREARRSPAFALGGELLVYSSSTSFTPLMAIPLSRARLGIDMKGQWSAEHECWTLHAPAVGAAALPPMPEEEVQKEVQEDMQEEMQEVVHAQPPRVVLFAAASREESMSWLQACAERGATLEALASLDLRLRVRQKLFS